MSGLAPLVGVARSGLESVARHPLRSGATLLCLLAVLLPYAAGAGVGQGLLDQMDTSLEGGADLYLSGTRFGRAAPVPLAALETVRAVPGVRDAWPRIVGEIALGADRVPAVVVGVPADRLPPTARCVEGRLFRPGASHELVVGAELARRLRLRVGSALPPFYRNEAGEHVSTVVGLFRAELPVWEANLVFCSLETAAAIFAQPEAATSLLVTCAPGYGREVERALARLPTLAPGETLAPRVTSREELRALLPAGLRHLQGVFQLHFVLAFAVGIPLVMVTSGVGLAERRREAALLKATGWRTDQLLLRAAVESAALALLGAALSVVLAWAWLDLLDGAGVAGIFLPGAGPAPSFAVPFRLLPGPALLALFVSIAVITSGTLYATWRAASAPPALALR